LDEEYPLTLYTDPAISAIHHTLRPARRRLAVLILARTTSIIDFTSSGPYWSQPVSDTTNDANISVRELARIIVATERDIPVDTATGDDYHNMYNSLDQTHLPRLDDVGAVNYNQVRKQVSPDSNLPALVAVVSTIAPLTTFLYSAPSEEGQTWRD
jgi:hypothetical protein